MNEGYTHDLLPNGNHYFTATVAGRLYSVEVGSDGWALYRKGGCLSPGKAGKPVESWEMPHYRAVQAMLRAVEAMG